MNEIVNAKITGTSLGFEDHGIFTCFLSLDFGGSMSQGFGGYGLDQWVKEEDRRKDLTGAGTEFVRAILETVGVENWEDLKGRHVRVKRGGLGENITGIGNLLEDKWFEPKAWFAANYPKD